MTPNTSKYRKTAIKAIGEVLLIMLGILGAFAIEDWQERKKQDKLLKDTLNITMAELNNNYCELLKSHQHQNFAREKLKGLSKDMTEQQQEQLFLSIYSRGILQPAQLTSTAWDTAIATGAVRNIPITDANLIAQFYHDGIRYTDRVDLILGEMVKNDYKDISLLHVLSGLAGSIDSLWWFEKRQINRYEKHFEDLSKQYNYQQTKCEHDKS